MYKESQSSDGLFLVSIKHPMPISLVGVRHLRRGDVMPSTDVNEATTAVLSPRSQHQVDKPECVHLSGEISKN